MQTPGELSDSLSSPTDTHGRLKVAHRPSQLIDLTGVRRVLKPLLKSRTNLRLRSKLLVWLVVFSAAPTSAHPLLVRQPAQAPVQKQNEQDAPNRPPPLPTLPPHAETL